MFMVRSPTADYIAPRSVPVSLFQYGTSASPVSTNVIFNGGYVITDFGFISPGSATLKFNGTTTSSIFLNSTNSLLPNNAACDTKARNNYMDATCGILLNLSLPNPISKDNLGAYSFGIGNFASHPKELLDIGSRGRSKSIPLHTNKVRPSADYQRGSVDLNLGSYRYIIDKSSTNCPITGNTITFTDPYPSVTYAFPIGLGDILIDNATSVTFLVTAKVVNTVTAVAISGYKTVGSAYSLFATWTPNSGLMELQYHGAWCYKTYLFGTFTSASNVITAVGDHDGTFATADMQVNDYLIWHNSAKSPMANRVEKITAVDTGAKTVTLTGNATYSIAGMPIMLYYTVAL